MSRGTTHTHWRSSTLAAAGAVLLASLAACSGDGGAATPADGTIQVSGSSTVAPITEEMADLGRFEIQVAAEGTGDGFDRFCAGETVINDASTAITTEQIAACEDEGVDFVEVPIALDALTVIRHEDNTFATDLTTDELRAIWEPDSQVRTWRDVRDDWPEQEIGLYGRPEGSGTFDYFTYRTSGEAGAIRGDYEATDDMAELTGWVADDPQALAFLGVGNYLAADGEQRDQITNVSIDGVAPTLENAQSGDYAPFTRPLFLYVSTSALEQDAEVGEFVDYYLEHLDQVLPLVYFYPLSDEVADLAEQRWEARTTGSAFDGQPVDATALAAALEG
ncbi:phosphate ABC transporter substrate-binding protein [Serinicoccus sp. CUA-874]|uniref:PstS family phosphate ABC transporter substrate-binding protein n=1 Tax=Serinicoccus sp. CUA-874 TaxID=1517939 RepID=UPI000959AB85|nr:PstS family phosphate ABC transporter substrate-binding protein [Serinicoccus sp. CUA-874]OLT16365.1 phosphate ABC transporter substrate-binding protein [Serinicoccus sp. CUA-874]